MLGGVHPDDERHLRRAIAIAAASVARGGRPFGALLVDAGGRVVAEGGATPTADRRDWTAHSEMTALRGACAALPWDELAGCTLYASGEPCPMCAAATYWCNVRRLVFGAGEPAVRELRRGFARAAGIEMGCREVLDRAPHPVEVVGPLLEAEALAPHAAFWPQAGADA
jgi:tRNA(Arg) A34 adenosine deaminase TadA